MLKNVKTVLALLPSNIPAELKEADQWVLWRSERPKAGDQRVGKVPYRADFPDVKASSNMPQTWTSWDTAVNTWSQNRDNVAGLMFACGNGLGGIDLDNCVNPETGEIASWALKIIQEIDSYTEISVSGTGIHIFVRVPEAKGRKVASIEIYTQNHFLMVTGHRVPDTPTTVNERSHQVETLRTRVTEEQNRERQSRHRRGLTRVPGKSLAQKAPRPEQPPMPPNVTSLNKTDDEVIDRCHSFHGFTTLWGGDISGYESRSAADMALASHLAFACGPDEEDRVERIMRRSGLRREKWDRPDYLPERTIPKAYEERTEFYCWEATGLEAGPSTESRKKRPVVIIGPETDQVLCEIEAHLAGHLYERNGRLVRLDQAKTPPASDSITRATGSIMLTDVSSEQCQRIMSRCIEFRKKQLRQNTDPDAKPSFELRKTEAPAKLAKLLVNSNEWVNIPNLIGITNSPFIGPRGQLVQTPGYDESSGYLLVDDGTRWETIPSAPTPQQIQAAIDLLHDLVSDFPFENEIHRSAWLAMLLTVVGRPAIHGPVPLYWVDGNKASTGKTKLSRLIGLITMGTDPTEISFTSDEKELENRLAAILIAGDRFACFDNVTNSTKNCTLDRFLTSTFFGTRAFYKQKMLRLQNTTTLSMTGNNLILRGDLFRRVLRSRLVSELERPQYRTGFRHADIEEYTARNRGALLAAALTILRAHAVKGFPLMEGIEPLGSYSEWNRVVRHAMLQLGLADPVETQTEVVEDDEDHVKLAHVMEAWNEYNPRLEGTAAEIISRLKNCQDLPTGRSFINALREWTGTPIDKLPCIKTLGYRLREAKDKKIGSFQIIRNKPKTARGVCWALKVDS